MAAENLTNQECPECGSFMYEERWGVKELVDQYHLPLIAKKEQTVSQLQMLVEAGLPEEAREKLRSIIPYRLISEEERIAKLQLFLKEQEAEQKSYREKIREWAFLYGKAQVRNLAKNEPPITIKPEDLKPRSATDWLEIHQKELARERLALLHVLEKGQDSIFLFCRSCGYSQSSFSTSEV